MKDQLSSTTKVLYSEHLTVEYNNQSRFLQWFAKVALIPNSLKSHFPLIFLILFSFPLIFTGLDDTVLQLDEGADTFVSTTILKNGYPKHSDGTNYTMPYADIYDGIFVYRTWIPYYLQSASLLVFGQNTFSARLPFAIIGIFSIWGIYSFTLRWTNQKNIAFFASLLLATSIPALLYFRTARYIAIPILLTPLLLKFYITIFDKEKWNPIPITVVSIIYFHTMYVEFAGLIIGMLIHLYVYRSRVSSSNLSKVKGSAIITAAFCLPWLAIIPALMDKLSEFYTSASPLVDTSLWRFPKHFFAFLFQINNYIFPFILAPFLFITYLKHQRFQVSLLSFCSISVLITASLHSIPLMQYISACIPLLLVLLAMIVFYIFEKSIARQSALLLVLIFTNLIHVGPLLPVKQIALRYPENFVVSDYRQYAYETFLREANLKSVFYQYWEELTHRYQGPLDKLVLFFEKNGKKGATCYIDSEFESLTFYTGMEMIPNQHLSPQHPPDWIVLRGIDRIFEGNLTKEARNVKEVLQANTYTRIELDAPAIQANNTYDIQIHQFRSPSSNDKVFIYQLSQHKKAL